ETFSETESHGCIICPLPLIQAKWPPSNNSCHGCEGAWCLKLNCCSQSVPHSQTKQAPLVTVLYCNHRSSFQFNMYLSCSFVSGDLRKEDFGHCCQSSRRRKRADSPL